MSYWSTYFWPFWPLKILTKIKVLKNVQDSYAQDVLQGSNVHYNCGSYYDWNRNRKLWMSFLYFSIAVCVCFIRNRVIDRETMTEAVIIWHEISIHKLSNIWPTFKITTCYLSKTKTTSKIANRSRGMESSFRKNGTKISLSRAA